MTECHEKSNMEELFEKFVWMPKTIQYKFMAATDNIKKTSASILLLMDLPLLFWNKKNATNRSWKHNITNNIFNILASIMTEIK